MRFRREGEGEREEGEGASTLKEPLTHPAPAGRTHTQNPLLPKPTNSECVLDDLLHKQDVAAAARWCVFRGRRHPRLVGRGALKKPASAPTPPFLPLLRSRPSLAPQAARPRRARNRRPPLAPVSVDASPRTAHRPFWGMRGAKMMRYSIRVEEPLLSLLSPPLLSPPLSKRLRGPSPLLPPPELTRPPWNRRRPLQPPHVPHSHDRRPQGEQEGFFFGCWAARARHRRCRRWWSSPRALKPPQQAVPLSLARVWSLLTTVLPSSLRRRRLPTTTTNKNTGRRRRAPRRGRSQHQQRRPPLGRPRPGRRQRHQQRQRQGHQPRRAERPARRRRRRRRHARHDHRRRRLLRLGHGPAPVRARVRGLPGGQPLPPAV